MRKPLASLAVLAAIPLALTACSAGGSTPESAAESAAESSNSSSAEGAASVLRVATLGSPTDTLDITQVATYLPWLIDLHVFDSLAILKGEEVELLAAESIEPNQDFTEWTITLRDSMAFTDGSPVTAADALYSLRYLGSSPVLQPLFGPVDWDAATAVDDTTLVIPMTAPNVGFVDQAVASVSMIFPEGTTDFAAAPSSGPYVLEEFSPETGAVLTANADYWAGKPEIEELQLTSIPDPATRATALESGQIDYAAGITATSAETLATNSQVEILESGLDNSTAMGFTLNTSIPPFNDPEVREAFKESVDRQQLVDVVFRGNGELGNDLFGKGLTGSNPDVPQRERNVEHAKQVFADKGVTEVTVLAGETTPGMMDSVRLVGQQLEEVGVTLKVDEADPATIYSDMDKIYSAQMFANYLVNRPFAVGADMYSAPGSPYNFTFWEDPEYIEKLNASHITTDKDERQELLDRMQQLSWEKGGDLVWGYQPVLHAHIRGIEGIQIIQSVPYLAQATLSQ